MGRGWASGFNPALDDEDATDTLGGVALASAFDPAVFVDRARGLGML